MTPNANDLGTAEWLVSELVRARLVERGQIEPIVAEFQEKQPYADANALADFLVRRRVITAFQAAKTLEGEARKLVLGPYLLVDTLGNGSMGAVYLGLGRADRQRYAVKVLPLRSLWNVRLARKQVRAFAELAPHAGVLPFLDVGTAMGVHYLVWPFAEGQDLGRMVRDNGPLPFIEVARIGVQVAEILNHCQPRGLVHGLVKPSNVMLSSDNQVRLLDFGIGALLAENMDEEESLIDTISTANATAGILDCASPESIVDPTKRTATGDQYSLGCTLYYATTGRFPFLEGNAVEKMMAHQSLSPEAIPSLRQNVPPGLVSVIERLMSKRPEGRFGSFDELIDNLMPLTRGSLMTTKPKGVPTAVIGGGSASGTKPVPEAKPKAPPANAWEALKANRLAEVGTAADEPKPRSARSVIEEVGRTPPPSQQPTPPPMPKVAKSSGSSMAAMPSPVTPVPLADDDDFDSVTLPKAFGQTPVRTAPNPQRPMPTSDVIDIPDLPASRFGARLAPEAPKPAPVAPPPPPARKLSVSLPPPPKQSIAEKLGKSLMFWAPKADIVQCSAFAVGKVSPGDSVAVQVFTHHPDATESVLSLAQQFHPDTAVVGAGYLRREVPRNTKIQLFLDVQGSTVDLPLQELVWRGQPALLSFTVTVPAHAAKGVFAGVLSLGQNNLLIGQVPVQFTVV